MKVLVTGSSGLIGKALVSFLTSGHHEVIKLVRARADLLPNEIAWDPEKGIINKGLLENLDAVVHLAGENITGRWTQNKKKRIIESRVNGTMLLSKALSELHNPPEVFVSASAIGYYGNQGSSILNEKSPAGSGFLADVCQEWEEATQDAKERGIRTVNLRIGMVLDSHGGALKKMLTPFKLCLGGVMGSGAQYISWITLNDLIGVIFYLLKQTNISGPVNGVSPQPVTNKEFTKTLGSVLHRPTILAMPAPIVSMLFGEMGDEILLSSQRVKPEVLLEKGYRYQNPELKGALEQLLK
jgi:uncharacterized protein